MPNIYPKSKLAALKPGLSIITAATATISRAELAASLDKSQDTIDRLAERGEGPPRFKVGREWRYRVIDVENWLAQRVAAEVQRKQLGSKPRKRTKQSANEVANIA